MQSKTCTLVNIQLWWRQKISTRLKKKWWKKTSIQKELPGNIYLKQMRHKISNWFMKIIFSIVFLRFILHWNFQQDKIRIVYGPVLKELLRFSHIAEKYIIYKICQERNYKLLLLKYNDTCIKPALLNYYW